MQTIWSYGGGTQSIAMAILVRQGRLTRPDRVVIADTGYEFSRTWQYTEEYVSPMLAEIELTIEIASHSLSTVGLYSHKGELLIPGYTARGKLPTFCSNEWKQLVVRRHIGGYKAYPDGVIMWLGMSLDELGRLKHANVDWITHHWPLCFDVKMRRAECKQLILDYGLPEPIKSRCFMCPHQGDDEWIEIQQSQEWERAVALDQQIYQSHGVRLHWSGVPLRDVVFKARGQDTREPLFDCQSGFCWT